MACIDSFAPTGLDIGDDGVSDNVAIRFEKGADHVELMFGRDQLPALFDHILLCVKRFEPTVLTAADLVRGGPVSFQEYGLRSDRNGDVTLDIHLRTDAGLRTMSWQMAGEKARRLADDIGEHAASAISRREAT